MKSEYKLDAWDSFVKMRGYKVAIFDFFWQVLDFLAVLFAEHGSHVNIFEQSKPYQSLSITALKFLPINERL